jgi:diaminohydroxyphosphoribosylaminopyrimidine deaminase / 5-amino-6-(5-phosphoribosylamino)uracil reductase
MTEADHRHMRLALRLARLGAGWTHPNPRVGAVAVQGGRVVGVGAHLACGAEHAEAVLLRRAGPAALRGSTLYVTLEPCCHVGRTPACAPAIIRAGVARVVAAMADPHPLVNGGGFAQLRAAGIEVEVGLFERRAARLNAPFLWMLLAGRAFVTLKIVASLDGRSAARDGTSRWISGPQAREVAHGWRAGCDAILVGRGTLETDRPGLSARPARDPLGRLRRLAAAGRDGVAVATWPHQPVRIVLDSRAAVASKADLLDYMAAEPGGPWVVACDERAPQAALRRLEQAGVRCWSFGVRQGARGVDLRALAARLVTEGLPELLVEGGPTVATAFCREDLVDRYRICTAPVVLGGPGAWLGDAGFRTLDEAPRLEFERVRRLGDDMLWDALSPSAARVLAGAWKTMPARGRTDRESCPAVGM